MRFRYFVARWAGVHLVGFLIASRSVRTGEYLAVRLERQPVTHCRLVKKRWIVRGLQQRRSNFLRFRHPFVHGIKASFLVSTFEIAHVSQSANISIADMKSHLSDMHDISIINLRGAGEGSDAAQIGFRAILWGDGGYPIRAVLQSVTTNYSRSAPV